MIDNDISLGCIESDGLKLSYRRMGKTGGMPVLLLHGLLYFSYDWIAIASELATDREVVALDQRGFGDSDWSPSESYSVADFTRDVGNVIKGLGWDRCVLVGHSMGGRNAAAAAIAYPDRIAGLVLMDSPPANAPHGARRIGDQVAGVPALFKTVDAALEYFAATPWSDKFDPKRRERFEAYLKPVRGGYVIKRDPYFHRLFLNMKATWPYHSYEHETWPMGQEFNVWQAWAALQCPTFVINGSGTGDITSPEMIRKIELFAAEKNPRIEPITYVAHHNLPGRNARQMASDIQRMAIRVENRV